MPTGLADERCFLTNFDAFGLTGSLLKSLQSEGLSTPTPIQEKAIPAALDGMDIIGIAQTGTGKTASFVLPILHHLIKSGKKPAPKTCQALILTPTRELAAQILGTVKAFSKHERLRSALVIGGVNANGQIRAVAPGVDVLVATPGRLQDLIDQRAISLKHCRFAVLDEADQMLDLGFLPAVRKLMRQLPDPHQTILMSATMPDAIQKLASDFLKDPREISVAPASKPIERIEQSVLSVPKSQKRQALIRILEEYDIQRAIIFTRTKRGADKLCTHLKDHGHTAAAIHGNKSQTAREKALAAFRKNQVTLLVATDIAARGIDIDDVTHVVNFDLPEVAEAYVHRIGRTARAGRSGVAFTICAPEEQDLLRSIKKLTGSEIPLLEIEGLETVALTAGGGKAKPAGKPAQKPKGNSRNRRRSNRRRNPDGTGSEPQNANAETKTKRPRKQRRPNAKPGKAQGRKSGPGGNRGGHKNTQTRAGAAKSSGAR